MIRIRRFICRHFGHKWVAEGGRPCPKKIETDRNLAACLTRFGLQTHLSVFHSQTVYRCSRCGDFDYGQEGGPAYQECHVDCKEEAEKQ